MKKTCLLATLTALAFFAPLLKAVPLPADWKSSATARKAEGNYHILLKDQSPCQLIVQQKGGRIARITVSKDSITAQELLDNGNTVSLPVPKNYPVDNADSMDVTLKIRENEWSIYMGGQLRAIMPAPFSLPGIIATPVAQQARQVEAPKFLPIPRAQFITNFMIEEGAPNELYPWVIQTGSWRLHTAQEQAFNRPETDKERTKAVPLTADKSPNFYSLKGGGKNVDNVITAGYEIYDNYSMTGSIQLENGEAGLVFYYRDEIVPENQKPNPEKAEYYAFTLVMNTPAPGNTEVRLWHKKDGKKTILARAKAPLYSNQWYLPGIAAHGDEIICYLDHFELFRVKEPLPVSGKFGLFVNTPKEMRLDDITVKHFADIKLGTVADIAFNTLAHSGNITVNDVSLAKAEPDTFAILNMGGSKPASLVVGRPHGNGEVFSALFKPHGENWKTSLIANWQSPDKPHLEFTVDHAGNTETYTLSTVTPDAAPKIIESFSHQLWDSEKTSDIELMIDSTEAGQLRCLRNGKLVHIIEQPKNTVGAFGIATAAKTNITILKLTIDTERQLFFEQEQKNPIFKTDSFMRHWASPEGQWIAGRGKALWHKGDFFTDYTLRLPCIPDSTLSLAVPDNAEDGPVNLAIKDGKIFLSVADASSEKPAEYSAQLTPPQGKGIDVLDYVVHHEGHWLWITVGNKTLFRHRLAADLRKIGTQARVRGLTLQHLSRSKVTRSNVIDEFFNESPHDWLANGGDWQIINRFQCTPSWSHMICEAYQTLGAFWRKQIFSGDLTLEFYAGSRQGAYDVMGNLNCTIMAADNTASSGYTVACTEWDQNHSQNWTTFYKNGIPLDKTNTYLVPRTRKGLVRKNLNPLIAEGRPYHGAWYYIKLRKIGDKLEYYFDDELIFSEKDPQAIQEGLVGIWTFIHSMTLAQIKITFDSVRPRPIFVEMLPVEDTKQPNTEAASNRQIFASSVNGFPLDALNRERWTVKDPVGQSYLEAFDANGAQALIYRNVLGAGDMKMTAEFPDIDGKDIAGWSFKTKRTDKALFNAFYSTSVINEKDKNKTFTRRSFHHISGDSFSDGQWRMTGETEVPPVDFVLPEDKNWTKVNVWLQPRPFANNRKTTVKFQGFGLEQLDATHNGIFGNPPRSAYAVADLCVVTYGVPKLTFADGETFKAYQSDGKTPVAAASAAELEKQLTELSRPGLNSAWLELTKNGQTQRNELQWIILPEKVPFTLEWASDAYDAIRLTHTANYPDPRFAQARVFIGKDNISNGFFPTNDSRTIYLPRTPQIAKLFADGKITFTVFFGEKQEQITLETSKGRKNNGPVLFKLNGFTPFYCNFETNEGLAGTPLELTKDQRQRREFDNEGPQGRYLLSRNTGYGQRLHSSFKPQAPFSIAQFPIVQLRYCASDMAYVSMDFNDSDTAFVRMGADEFAQSVHSRHGSDLVFDEKWHSWIGIVSDAFKNSAWIPERFIQKRLHIRSSGHPDQTGYYSKLALDDLVLGPAVHSAQQLAFKPEFFDFDGVTAVFTALSPIDEKQRALPYHELSEEVRKSLNWKRFEANTEIVPDLTGVSDGICHLFLKAVDGAGHESAVIDLPFMLCSKPLETSFSFIPSKAPLENGTLMQVKFANHGLAPIQLDQARFKIGDAAEPARLDAWTEHYIHETEADILNLDYPFIFREQLNNANDGDELKLIITGIIDGAGNKTPDLTIPFKVNYASDKTAPSWYTQDFGSSILTYNNWDGHSNGNMQFRQGANNQISVVTPYGVSPYLQNGTHYNNGDLIRSLSWKPSRHPFIAFRLNKNVIRNGSYIHLIIHTTDNKYYSINLNAPGKEGNELNRSQTFAWKANTWYRFAFDVQKMLLDIGIKQETINAMTIDSVTFQRRGGNHHMDQLLLDDFFVFGMPDNPQSDMLQWSAFDASGIAGLQMECLDDNDKVLFSHTFSDPHKADLSVIRQKFQGCRWFRVQAKDKAGNLSVPYFLPLYSAATQPAAPAK